MSLSPDRRKPALLLAGLLFAQSGLAGCFVSVNGFDFGLYDVFDPLFRDTTSALSLSCQENKPQDVQVSFSSSSVTGGIAERGMRGPGGDILRYNIFADSARTVLIGDGVTAGSPITVAKVSVHKPRQVVIYGRIPAGQDVQVGSYSDSLMITVSP